MYSPSARAPAPFRKLRQCHHVGQLKLLGYAGLWIREYAETHLAIYPRVRRNIHKAATFHRFAPWMEAMTASIHSRRGL